MALADLEAEDLEAGEPPEVGKMFFKKKIGKDSKEELINCPRCNIKMEKLKKEEVTLDICKRCGGMWLDKGETEKLIKIARRMRGEKSGKK